MIKDRGKLEISTNYSQGADWVDVDNDGIEELYYWRNAGSGRFLGAYVYRSLPNGKFEPIFSNPLIGGSHAEQRYFRYAGQNWLFHDSGGGERFTPTYTIARIVPDAGKHKVQRMCDIRLDRKIDKICDSPVCRQIAESIEKDKKLWEEVWPHAYFAPEGISVFYPETPVVGVDLDNDGRIEYVWKHGRLGYIYSHIYWKLLVVTHEWEELVPPIGYSFDVDDLRVIWSGNSYIEPILGKIEKLLRKHASYSGKDLLNDGEFYFIDQDDKTYWVWDIKRPPYGYNLHVVLYEKGQGHYIGEVTSIKYWRLDRCEKNCIEVLKP